MRFAPAGLGAGFGLGLLFIVSGMRRAIPAGRLPKPKVGDPALPRVVGAILAAIVTLAATRWLVGAMFAAGAAAALPTLLGGRTRRVDDIARAEAIAAWAEMLRDTMAAASGLEQAIRSTASIAPPRIRPQVRHLGLLLESATPSTALAAFTEEMDDPAADLVVAALGLALEHHARDLGSLLGALAESARARAAMRLRVEAGRARVRTAVRVVTVFTLGFAGGLVLLNRQYLQPFDDATGQLVLLGVGGCFSASLWQLHRMAAAGLPRRVLAQRQAFAG